MKNLIGLACCLAVVGCDASERPASQQDASELDAPELDAPELDAPEPVDPCPSIGRVPGIEDVIASSRANAVAEALAVRCGGGVAAPQALYEDLAADLDLIEAVDSRMVRTFRREPLVLLAFGDQVAAVRSALEEGTCGQKLTAALHGTTTEHTSLGTPRIFLHFAPDLDPDLVVAAYAELGITLEVDVGYPACASAQYRGVDGGREYRFGLLAGDGCYLLRFFVWRVAAGRAELIAEYGDDLDSVDGVRTPPPEGLDLDFSCD